MQNSSLPLKWWAKFIAIIAFLLVGFFYVVPTLFGDPQRWPMRDSATLSGEKEPAKFVHRVVKNFFPESRITLGLDLQGGLHLVLEVEIQKSIKDSISRALFRAKDTVSTSGINVGKIEVNDNFEASIELLTAEKKEEFLKEVSARTYLIVFDKMEGNVLKFKQQRQRIEEYSNQALQQAINTIRNRIDQFGVAEPSIVQQGTDRIVIQLPGLQDPARAKQLIGNTAQLEFRMVLNEVPGEELETLVNLARTELKIPKEDIQPETIEKISQWLRDQKKITTKATVMLERTYGMEGGSTKLLSARPYLVEVQSKLTGEEIEDASVVQTSQSMVPDLAVSMNFKPKGGKLFGELTTEAYKSENAPHQIAIILDRNISSAPSVNEPIMNGRAQITLGRKNASDYNAKLKEAQDLALVLRAGALPASVKIIEERQVGPSEGEENIRAGVVSTMIAAGILILMMLYFYGGAGIVANIALALNVVFILAFLAVFGATLTLPGIAGIVLTMAVAVDCNVVINERIREERRSGVDAKVAFYRGYGVSATTLIDANTTAAIAAIILMIYGNQAVKGFAITLLIGIFTTLFTSYWVTEVIGQFLLEKTKIKRFL